MASPTADPARGANIRDAARSFAWPTTAAGRLPAFIRSRVAMMAFTRTALSSSTRTAIFTVRPSPAGEDRCVFWGEAEGGLTSRRNPEACGRRRYFAAWGLGTG